MATICLYRGRGGGKIRGEKEKEEKRREEAERDERRRRKRGSKLHVVVCINVLPLGFGLCDIMSQTPSSTLMPYQMSAV